MNVISLSVYEYMFQHDILCEVVGNNVCLLFPQQFVMVASDGSVPGMAEINTQCKFIFLFETRTID